MSVEVHVNLMAAMIKPTGERSFTYQLDEGNTIDDLLKKLELMTDMDLLHQRLVIEVNNEEVTSSYQLQTGDSVFITVLLGGGG